VINKEGPGRRAKLDGILGWRQDRVGADLRLRDEALHALVLTARNGFAPLTNPAIVVVVTLNGTHGEGGLGG